MPLYEYQCARCGRFEVIRKFSDSPLLTCPTCGGEIQKLLSAPAIQFKGTGWYITDYARKSTGESSKGTEAGGKGKETAAASGSKDGASSSSDSAAGASKSGTSDTGSTSKGPAGGGGRTG